jgi:hypothetical protein
MHSYLQRIRNLLEAWWALSPTMVGMACFMLDLAVLLHLKASKPVSAPITNTRNPYER